MHYIATLSAFAAAATSVQALGSAYIINKCSFDTYLWPVDAERNPLTPVTIKAGSTWSEGYHTPSAGGVSLKISRTTKCQLVTQLEYTVQPYSGNNFVWYDGSNVDCTGTDCPFQAYGLELTTSKGSACPQRNCTAGAATCPGFYTVWNDDVNSLSCDDTADTLLTLCSEKGASSPSASYGSSTTASSTPASSTPASSTAASSTAASSTAASSTAASSTAAPKSSTKSSSSVSYAPTTTSAPAHTMEAVATTMLTKTHTRYHKARAVHNHARHHIG
ncbi:hypothetical protein BLS_005277 [Venturia inaequalis]|uniref:Uncharacterized protein n=1 Tax=Venturia inaequalis TaxID=5025 RepID=A0A8H3UQ68_VENIN|nr:hypothetical protein EG327_010004 [Venturia inaequalis]KAE9974549.1 hypothetical protein EG328_003766 [Venturia inaequalis]KAE9982876.1 hypothetical protein BLS_005277 [Venturia inaequalis]RDI83855.1 hypothetical protein Vi05172_g6430 [Venturia inaequalis]